MKDFSLENKLLLNLSALTPAQYDGFNGCDWETVLKLAKVHGVILTCFEEIVKQKSVIPQDTFSKFMNAVGTLIENNEKIYSAQAEVLSVLSDVDCLILKGLSSAVYYKNPESRMMGDVDVLVKTNDLERAQNILSENGYKRLVGDDFYDVLYEKDGTLIELHFSFAGIPGGEYGEKIKGFMSDVFDTAVESEFRGQKFTSPDDAHNALIMLLHLQHHLYYGWVGLKQVVDWSRFMQKTADMPFWEQRVLPLLKSIGLMTFTAALTKVCGKYLKSPVPLWAEEFKGDGKEIIDEVLKSGDVTLNGNDFKNSDVLLEKGEYRKRSRIALGLKYVHKKVVSDYPWVKKAVILYPFIYACKSCGYLFKSLFTRRKDFKEMNEFARGREKFHDKFKIFENNKW